MFTLGPLDLLVFPFLSCRVAEARAVGSRAPLGSALRGEGGWQAGTTDNGCDEKLGKPIVELQDDLLGIWRA